MAFFLAALIEITYPYRKCFITAFVLLQPFFWSTIWIGFLFRNKLWSILDDMTHDILRVWTTQPVSPIVHNSPKPRHASRHSIDIYRSMTICRLFGHCRLKLAVGFCKIFLSRRETLLTKPAAFHRNLTKINEGEIYSQRVDLRFPHKRSFCKSHYIF